MGGTKRKSTKKENILDGFGNDQFINQMLQNNNSGDQLPELGLVDDLGMDTTDIKESMMTVGSTLFVVDSYLLNSKFKSWTHKSDLLSLFVYWYHSGKIILSFEII